VTPLSIEGSASHSAGFDAFFLCFTAGFVEDTAVRLLALSALVFALPPFHSAIRPVAPAERTQLTGEFWRGGCPVGLTSLRLLTVSYWDFAGNVQTGQLVVNSRAAAPLAKVFRQLYRLQFPIRHMQFADVYGPKTARPRDRDVSGSFECRKAVPSPCGSGTGNWSNHAYGLAVDLNPIENPYTGCGRTRERASIPYLNRSKLRPGMVTPAVVRAFRSIGWGWGGTWSGATKDYMHFSWNGH
jgi:D-alanyl-D-alanine carboxypeptidase